MVRGQKNPLHFGLAKRLRAARRLREIGGKPLSLAANLAATTVLRIESEASVPSIEAVERLASVLKVSPGYLAYGIELPFDERGGQGSARLPERLRMAREQRGLSLNALAKLAGVARTTIGYIEDGVTMPSIATVELLARALGIEACWLAYGEENRTGSELLPQSDPG